MMPFVSSFGTTFDPFHKDVWHQAEKKTNKKKTKKKKKQTKKHDTFRSDAVSILYLYEPRHDKMCLREFPTRPDTNRPAPPQKLARVLKFRL